MADIGRDRPAVAGDALSRRDQLWRRLLPRQRAIASWLLFGLLALSCLVISSCHARPFPRPEIPGPGAGPGQAARDTTGQKPLFMFAAIADPHVSQALGDMYTYIKATDKSAQLLAACIHDINAHMPPVDFVVLLGDIADRGRKAEFDTASKIMDSLKCPFYAVVGNHDNFQSDHKAAWMKFAHRDSTNYTFDRGAFHFIVIDCTKDPYPSQNGVECESSVREWVAHDLSQNVGKHVMLFCHYNMWRRPWNPQFDTTGHYDEYPGMKEMRQVLERAGNVCAVVNGHVHANRMEIHNGIYYIDVGATLVGRPSIRYFTVFPDRIEVSYAYISDRALLEYVEKLGEQCTSCFDRKRVTDFADGSDADKRFTIPLK
ncbi:MAG TPA: metallophosphoesterase [bacterium]|nr:metallophosphoesterase [bacterium]